MHTPKDVSLPDGKSEYEVGLILHPDRDVSEGVDQLCSWAADHSTTVLVGAGDLEFGIARSEFAGRMGTWSRRLCTLPGATRLDSASRSALPRRFHSPFADMSVRCCDGRHSASEAASWGCPRQDSNLRPAA